MGVDMPRKKLFRVDDAMHKAMVAFWHHGYKSTSLDDLVQCMAINRASLYNTFGDKPSLFINTLTNYNNAYLKPYLEQKVKAYSPRQAILTLFEDRKNELLKDEEQKGCFMMNTAMDLSSHDGEVKKLVGQSLNYIEENFFRKMIKRGQTSGEISRSVNPTRTARVLLNMIVGLHVLAHNRPQKALLDSITGQVEDLVPPGDAVAIPTPTHRPKVRSNVVHPG